MAESSPNRLKTQRENEKLLITSNFSFSHSVFKRLVLQTRKYQGLFEKGLSCHCLKAFADDKINVIEKWKFVLERIKNIVGKGENAGFQHFLLFPHCFQKASCTGSLKVRIVCKELTLFQTYLFAVQIFCKHCGKRRNCLQ